MTRLPFPDLVPKRRRSPRVLAKWTGDAGEIGFEVRCERCGWEDWVPIGIAQARRGYPCPTCNLRTSPAFLDLVARLPEWVRELDLAVSVEGPLPREEGGAFWRWSHVEGQLDPGVDLVAIEVYALEEGFVVAVAGEEERVDEDGLRAAVERAADRVLLDGAPAAPAPPKPRRAKLKLGASGLLTVEEEAGLEKEVAAMLEAADARRAADGV